MGVTDGRNGWASQAMEMTMKVFIEKYSDKLAAKRVEADAAAPASKKAKM